MPQLEPSPRRGRRSRSPCFAVLLAAAFVPLLFAAVPARAGLCVVVDPLFAVGCKGAMTTSSTSAVTEPPSAPDEPVTRSSTTTQYDPERIAVTVSRWASPRQIAAAFAGAGVQLEQAVPAIHAYLVRVSPARQAAAVRSLRSSAVVVRAGPDVIAHTLDTTPNDSQWPSQTGLRVIGLPRAWDTSRGSAGLLVAVVDTGVDASQPDLRGALVAGVNLIDPTSPPRDDHGHGTAVAGVVGARSNNGQGMAGVCWFCLIMPVKVLDSSGSGDDTRIAAGIVWAVDHGARVINLSLGGPGNTPELAAALAYASRKGAIAVAAAGNSGTTLPFYPAADANALSVGATTTADRAYAWSNYGPLVDVAAPGCNVAPLLGGGYRLFCGTSSSAPIVSGLAALVLSTHPGATPAEIRSAIERSGAPLPSVVQFGRVDAPRALAALGATARRTQLESGTLSSARLSRSYELQSGPGPVRATVRFRAGSVVTLVLESLATGMRVAHKTGRSPLQLSEPVGGPVRVVVRAVRGVPLRFTLTLGFSPAVAGSG
jgi:subtilisin family serine protease